MKNKNPRIIINDDKNILRSFRGRRGEIVATVRDSFISGHKRIYLKEYIVQFDHPLEWSYFGRFDFVVESTGKRHGYWKI